MHSIYKILILMSKTHDNKLLIITIFKFKIEDGKF